jgi:hypothetical protein
VRKHRSGIRLLVSLCTPLMLFPLQAAPWNEWLSANGGSGVEYRWIIGLLHACHTEFRDPVIAGTDKATEISASSIMTGPRSAGLSAMRFSISI